MSSSPFSCLVMNRKMSWRQDRKALEHLIELTLFMLVLNENKFPDKLQYSRFDQKKQRQRIVLSCLTGDFTQCCPGPVPNLEFVVGGVGGLGSVDPEDVSQTAGHQ